MNIDRKMYVKLDIRFIYPRQTQNMDMEETSQIDKMVYQLVQDLQYKPYNDFPQGYYLYIPKTKEDAYTQMEKTYYLVKKYCNINKWDDVAMILEFVTKDSFVNFKEIPIGPKPMKPKML